MNQGRHKLLLVVTKSNFGGAQRYVYDLAVNAPKDTFDVVVAFGAGGAGGSVGRLSEMLALANIRTIFIPELTRDVSFAGDLRALRALYRLFQTERPDIIHLNSSKAAGLGALAARVARVKRIVFTVHGLPWDESRSAIQRTLIYLATRLTMLLCDTVITVSKNDDRRARGLFSRKKVHLVRNGIEPVEFLSRAEARARLSLNVPETTIVVGTIAELTRNKNIEVALAAFAQAHAKNPSLFYVIVGTGEQYDTLLTYAKEIGIDANVLFTGYVADAATLLIAFDIFFLPSQKEGLPYVLLEAGLASLPVIASNVGGIPEIIENGVSGILHAPNDIEGFTGALTALSSDGSVRASLGASLQKTVTSECSLKTMLEKTFEMYLT